MCVCHVVYAWSATQLCLSSIQAAVKETDSSVFVLDTSASITASRIADCLAAQGLLEEVQIWQPNCNTCGVQIYFVISGVNCTLA